jgi:hypothetical protein
MDTKGIIDHDLDKCAYVGATGFTFALIPA